MRPAWAFGAESLATHPSRTERGKEWGTLSLLDRRKAGPAPSPDTLLASDSERKILHLDSTTV